MTTFKPKAKAASSTPLQAVDRSTVLVGASVDAVRQACSNKVMSGRGSQRAHTGAYFLNVLTPKLFAQDPKTEELHAIKGIYANFDNSEDSVAVHVAEALSEQFLNTLVVDDLDYRFKLIDSKTKVTIATDMPDYEESVEATEDDTPEFLRVTPRADNYIPNPAVCAWLKIYVMYEDRPVMVASNDIPATRYNVASVDKVRELVANDIHLQAGAVPQAKIEAWALAEMKQQADLMEESGFIETEEAVA